MDLGHSCDRSCSLNGHKIVLFSWVNGGPVREMFPDKHLTAVE
jgi:hypothetical protein